MSAFDFILDYLKQLEGLNPDVSGSSLRKLYEAAEKCSPEHFETLGGEVEKLIELSRQDPAEQVGQAILREYHNALENSARLLAAHGEISPLSDERKISDSGVSMALVCSTSATKDSLTRCKILCRSKIPVELTRAADAYRRRIEVVDSVYSIGFEVLRHVDANCFMQWVSGYLERNRGNLLPEVIRDLLASLRGMETLNADLQQWVMAWCADEDLLEHWPLVTRYADRTLGNLALRRWAQQCLVPKNHSLAHLKLLIENHKADDAALLSWLTNTLQNFGEGVERFMALENRGGNEDEKWHQPLLLLELHSLASVYPVIMMTAEHLLDEPDGAAKLAMAFLGIIGEGLAEWEGRMKALSENVVRRAFLIALKNGETPVETIQRFTFGDKNAFEMICNDLDLLSRRFDSIQQRERVVRRLAVYYTSYRRTPMLGIEVGKRYRHLARILHEDYLSARIPGEELDALQKTGILHELYTMAAYAKRFLDHRRALEMTVEEMLASEMDFVHQVRSRRLEIIRTMLK